MNINGWLCLLMELLYQTYKQKKITMLKSRRKMALCITLTLKIQGSRSESHHKLHLYLLFRKKCQNITFYFRLDE